MGNRSARTTAVIVGAVAVTAVVGAGATAYAVWDDDESSVRGTCAGSAYTLTAEDEDGGLLDLSAELTAAPGEAWDVRLVHDGEVLVDGTRRADEDGEVDLDAVVPDGPGTDTVAAAFAARGASEPCTAELRHG